MGNDRDVAVCVIVFNRPEITQKLFNILKENSPKNLHIICDGPRNELEKINVDRVKDIFENIDWPCHVTKDYANQNMGCRERIVSGLDNLFKLYGAAIILEDDCHPVDPIFFEYCYNMLERYWEDDSIMHISGFQPMTDVLHDNSSYLATFPFVWGWATWADSWKKNISNTIFFMINSFVKKYY